MFDKFVTNINTAFNLILQPYDVEHKKKELVSIKKKIGLEEHEKYGSLFYEYLKTEKRQGVVYTPEEIASYIVEGTISEEEIIRNPYIKIIDPACGAGNILIPCFHYLRRLFKKNLKIINERHNLSLNEEGISRHIVHNNLYGADIDELSIKILSIDLFSESGYICSDNIQLCDFLIENKLNTGFDIFIGNPPYIGHKAVDREYSLLLKREYSGIYKDKGDISYCFFKRAMDLANEVAKISFITSRYFMEAPSGLELRKAIKNDASIKKIFDFYGIRPFKEAGIDPVIIFLESGRLNQDIEIVRPFKEFKDKSSFKLKDAFINTSGRFDTFSISSSDLKEEGWIIVNNFERNMLNKIESKCIVTLEDICASSQGIITGCDAAFIIEGDSIINAEKLEQDIIKPWIKGRDIKKFGVTPPSKYLIYSNLIDREENYPNVIRHIASYKEKLSTRRECMKGIRKWYELQWGRKKEIFEEEKIVFPYKSSSNRFALDEGSFFSADIYSMSITKKEYADYKSLLQLLNSSIYEFYFKTFAKKLGDNMYEYYPNTVMKLRLPDLKKFKSINDDILFDYFDFGIEEKDYILRLYGKG
jgi:adenine-specific DNA-methyltransferase